MKTATSLLSFLAGGAIAHSGYHARPSFPTNITSSIGTATGYNNHTYPSSPVSWPNTTTHVTSAVETIYTTYTTLCTEDGTTILHTVSAPLTTETGTTLIDTQTEYITLTVGDVDAPGPSSAAGDSGSHSGSAYGETYGSGSSNGNDRSGSGYGSGSSNGRNGWSSGHGRHGAGSHHGHGGWRGDKPASMDGGNGFGSDNGRGGSSSDGSSSPDGYASAPKNGENGQGISSTSSLETTLTEVPYGIYTPSGWSSIPADTTYVTVADVVTIYETVLPVESTYTSGSSTYTSKDKSALTTLTLTSTYQVTNTITSTAGYALQTSEQSSPHAETTYVTVTDATTIYTTVCPIESTYTSEGSTYTSTNNAALTTSTLTSTYQITETVTSTLNNAVPASKQSSVPADTTYVTVSAITTTYTTVCPIESTYTSGASTHTSTISSVLTTSTLTSTYYVTSTVTSTAGYALPTAPSAPADTTYVTVTDVTTTYTTTSASATTYTSGDVTFTSTASDVVVTLTETETYHVTSTVTSTFGDGGVASTPAGATAPFPISNSTTTLGVPGNGINATNSRGPLGTGSSSSSSIAASDIVIATSSDPVSTSASPSSSVFGATGTSGMPINSANATSSIPVNIVSSSSSNVAATGTGASSGMPSSSINGTASVPVLVPSSTGPSDTTGTSGVPVNSANGTASLGATAGTSGLPINSANGTMGVPTTSSAILSATPIGTGATFGWPIDSANATTSTPPTSIAATSTSLTSSSSSVSSSSSSPSSTSSTSTCSTPTPSPMCIPCEGQPSNNYGSDGPEPFCGLTTADNPYQNTPITCQTREYNFEVTNTTLAPDGIPRIVLAVNGQMPGPTIEANWGDEIVVNVKNSMQNNGTTIHWHGLRQYYTNEMDGVPSITQCPIAPGESYTYRFRADSFGTSWYHSHFSVQAYEGVFGPIVIHGPASVEKTWDAEQVVVVQDWSHHTVNSMYDAAQTAGKFPQHGPRTLDTGLINGMNIWGQDNAKGTTGQRFEMNVQHGSTYMIRLVSTAIQSTFKFYIDGHKFTVISADFVAIEPYETNVVSVSNGQRYTLLVTFDQPVANYWMRADNAAECSSITAGNNIRGIVRYAGAAPNGIPTSTANTYSLAPGTGCADEPLASLIPAYKLNAAASNAQIDKTITIGSNSKNLYKWSLSGTTFQSQWGDPTLVQIYENGTVPTVSGPLAIQVPNLGEWVYLIIDSPIPFPHPIHLHGHDFYILAQGTGLYNAGVKLNLESPPRRDVAMMPWNPSAGQGGHLVIAWPTDNPGAWLIHCHIGWHVAMGFALQVIENLEGIKETVTDGCMMEETCRSWHQYTPTSVYDYMVEDSGV